MVCLGLKPGAAGWKAKMNPLSYGGIPYDVDVDVCLCVLVTLPIEGLSMASGFRENNFGHSKCML